MAHSSKVLQFKSPPRRSGSKRSPAGALKLVYPIQPSDFPSAKKSRVNWFLGMTMGVSIALHLVLFWIFTSVPLFPPATVTDLTFQDFQEAPSRSIPRPRPTAKELTSLDDIKDIKSLKVTAIPPLGPVKTESAGRSQGTGVGNIAGGIGADGTIGVPAVPSAPAGNYELNITQWNPRNIAEIPVAAAEYSTPQHYFEMVKMRIERVKKYPERARQTGSVTLKFVITGDGQIKNPEVTRSSRNSLLDEAAMKALKDAAPFPKPPLRLFKGDLTLQVSIVFELT